LFCFYTLLFSNYCSITSSTPLPPPPPPPPPQLLNKSFTVNTRVKLNIFRPLSFVETRFSSVSVNAEFRSIKKSYHFHSLKSESYLTTFPIMLQQGLTTSSLRGRLDLDLDLTRYRPKSTQPDLPPCRPRPTPTRPPLLNNYLWVS